jgi:tetratricopeptide (TPR) repeat protein
MYKHKKPSNNQFALDRPDGASGSAISYGPLAGAILIVVVSCIAYFPALKGGFIWDDEVFVINNRFIKAQDGLYRFWFTTEPVDYWPLTNTMFWLQWRLWGLNPAGYHVTNLILHVIEALLIWIILRKLAIPGSFLTGIIFAVHPVNVETVAWIAQLKGLSALLFFLLSILWYLKALMPATIAGMAPPRSQGGPREGENLKILGNAHLRFAAKLIPNPQSLIPIWYWLSLAAFLLAAASKGSVTILPFLLLGIVWWIRPLEKRDLTEIAPFFLIAVVLSVVNMWFQTHGTGEVIRVASFANRLLGAGAVVWFYLYKTFLPINLSFVYPLWHIKEGNPLWWLPLLLVLAVSALFWRNREKWSRPLLFAWYFFCVALAPVMGFTDVFFMRYSLVADHYQHIAIIGIIALTSSAWRVWQQRTLGLMHWAATAIPFATIGTFAFLSVQQSGLYRDEITLFSATLENNPECWMLHNNLGKALYEADRYQEAIEQYQETLHFNPDYPQALYNIGLAKAKINRPQEAIDYYRKALRFKPNCVEAHHNLSMMLVQIGRPREAIEHDETALRLKPDYPEAHNNLGVAYIRINRPQEAIEHFEQAIRLRADYATACYNLALAYAKIHKTTEAIAMAKKALMIARSQRNPAQIKQIEDWLNTHHINSPDHSDHPNNGESVLPSK